MKKLQILLLIAVSGLFLAATSYPYDGYDRTGIKRLLYVEKVKNGELQSKSLRPGAFKPLSFIKLNLADRKVPLVDCLPKVDASLQSQIERLFRGMNRNYSLTVMDMSEGKPVRYAEHRPTSQYQPGSVGKLVVLTAFFTGLEKVYPNSFNKRLELLKTKQVRAGGWVVGDHHTIPVFNPESGKLSKRHVRQDDVFSLFEWADHMVSVSNNGAACVTWREAVLMHAFGDQYPSLTEEQANEYFKTTPKSELSEFAMGIVNQPLRDLGITENEWRLGKFFTGGAGRYIPGRGGSTGTPLGLMKWVLALEQGMIVDEKTSLEMKRLLFLTDRRIRYAYSHELDSAAVYFKSGSLYKCDRNKNPNCGKYKGNVYNYMNSVAIIEHDDGTRYAVCLMSNVLGKNSAYDHLELATRIDKIMRGDE